MRKFGIYGILAAVGSLALLATTTGCSNREASAATATVAPQGAFVANTRNAAMEADGLVLVNRDVFQALPEGVSTEGLGYPKESYSQCEIHAMGASGPSIRYINYTVTCPNGKSLTLKRSINYLGPGEIDDGAKYARFISDPGGGIWDGCVIGSEQIMNPGVINYEIFCSPETVFNLPRSDDFQIDKRLEEYLPS